MESSNGKKPDYFSYSFNDIINDPAYKELTKNLNAAAADLYESNITNENDYYSQLGDRYKLLSEEEKNNLVQAVTVYIKSISGPKSEYMVNMQLCHWFRTDINLGIAIAKGLDLDLSETMKQMPNLM